MWVISLNVRLELIAVEAIARGGINSVSPEISEIFRCALRNRANKLAIVHNHPSGTPDPSDADLVYTRQLIRAAQTLRIQILDHVIVGLPTAQRPKDYASLRELGLFAL